MKFRPNALSYRLAAEAADYDAVTLDASLGVYYSAALDVTKRRDKLLFWYIVLIGALYAQSAGLLEGFQFSGLAFRSEATAHFLLLMTSTVTLLFAFTMAKVNRYVQIFDYSFQSSTGARKQDLILRYPEVFSPLHFHFWMTGAPKHMVHKKVFPFRVTLVLLLSLPAILVSILFFYWLVGSVSMRLWMTDTAGLGVWSKIIVAISIAMVMASAVVPTLSFKKIVFSHYGLLNGLERLRATDGDRYSYFVSKAFDAQERMGLNSSSDSAEKA